MSAKNEVAEKTQSRSVLDQIGNQFVEKPVAMAHKAFLAGIGFATVVQSGLKKRIGELAEDGEETRDKAQAAAVSIRDQASERFNVAQNNVTARVARLAETVLGRLSIATSNDVAKLSTKLDRLLVRVT